MTRTGIRASAIIIKDGKILLIHRRKEGKEYWVFSGGGIEEGETGEKTVLREVEEETGLVGQNAKMAFMDFNVNAEHPFYFVEVEEGEVKLGGPEAERSSKDNWYHLKWVSLKKVSKLCLFPESAKNKLIRLIGKLDKVDWRKIKDNFGKEMSDKLRDLPGHREVSEELRNFRNIISHELPETAPKALFRKLIKLLFSGEKVDVRKARREYLEPELDKEKQILTQYKTEFNRLMQSAKKWVEENLPEETLQRLWKNHKTWLPRRYTIYKKQPTFQKITTDTLARFYLLNKKEGCFLGASKDSRKKIHFVSKLVPLILSGKKVSTWRLWDDKNLSEGDVVDFLESETERHFATARLTKVIEKRMGDLTENDKAGHEKYKNDEEMFKTFEGFYKKKVDSDTRVKIIWFELIKRFS